MSVLHISPRVFMFGIMTQIPLGRQRQKRTHRHATELTIHLKLSIIRIAFAAEYRIWFCLTIRLKCLQISFRSGNAYENDSNSSNTSFRHDSSHGL